MAFNFPAAPVNGDLHTEFGVDYVWDAASGTWNLQSGGAMTDYVLKAGDTMTGDLDVQADVNATGYVRSQRGPTESTVALVYGDATNCGRVEWTNPDASRKGYLGYGGPTDLNLNLDSAERLNIAGGGISFGTQLGSSLDDISKGIEMYSGANGMGISTSNGGQFNFVLKNAAHAFNFRMGAAGKLTINTAGATVVNGGLFVGDAWHGWAYSSADSCEHLRSYQGKFQFRKTNGSTPGTLQATLDNGSLNLTGKITPLNTYTVTWANGFTGTMDFHVTPSMVTLRFTALKRNVLTSMGVQTKVCDYPAGVSAPPASSTTGWRYTCSVRNIGSEWDSHNNTQHAYAVIHLDGSAVYVIPVGNDMDVNQMIDGVISWPRA